MNTSAPTFAHGDVVSRLADVLRLASYRWKRDITPLDVANTTGLDPKTVRQMARQDPAKQPREYYFRTLRLLCWYFGTEGINDLLVWVPPPAKAHGQPPDPIIRRTGPPSDQPPRAATLRSNIRSMLKGKPRAEAARATGLRFQTISDLLDEERSPNRIHRRTLAALCDYLSDEVTSISPGDLLECSEGEEERAGPSTEHPST